MGRIVRGMLLGLLMVFAVGVWPAGATVDTSYTKVTSPANGSTTSGHYDSDDKPIAFQYTIRGQAKSSCSNGFTAIDFSISGPNSYSKTYPRISTSSGSSWSGGPSTPWDTQDLAVNGFYTLRMTVTDKGGVLCNGSTYPAKADVKVANAPATPQWNGAPSAASDGSAHVTLSWKKNAEDDIDSYHITRTGPDGSHTAVAPTSVCSGSTCSADDTSFPADYSGQYSYQIVTFRSAPSGTGEECAPNSSDRCVESSGSSIQSVTLTKPTPTPSPSPTGSPTGDGSTPTPGGGTSGTGGTGSHGKTKSGTRVLSFGGGGSSSYNEFYTGTYKETLPYQPKSFILGNGQTTAPDSRQVEAASLSDAPPSYRTIMLPVAGGLLAFLSAAHVRRLLIHF